MTVNLVHLNDLTNHYTFSAVTPLDAQQQMESLGPSDGDGHHAASCHIQAGILEGLQRGIVTGGTSRIAELGTWMATARITQGELRYRAIYRYPRWTNVHTLPRYVQAEWQRFTTCLRTHEQGHLNESMPLLREFRRRYDALRITGNGASAQAAETQAMSNLLDQVRDLYREMSFRCEQANQAYDRRTRHGRTQGARLRTRTTVRRSSRQ